MAARHVQAEEEPIRVVEAHEHAVSSPIVSTVDMMLIDPLRWVDQPVTVGFSEGKVTARSERDLARDFLSFLENWQDIFGVKNYRIFITGESYAGRYVPYISAAMLDRKDKERFDLRGRPCFCPRSAIESRLTDTRQSNVQPEYVSISERPTFSLISRRHWRHWIQSTSSSKEGFRTTEPEHPEHQP